MLIPVSKTEAVVEAFWDSQYDSMSRWSVVSQGTDASVRSDWDRACLIWKPKAAGESVEIAGRFDDDVSAYRRLIVRLRTNAGIRISASATVDGKPLVIAHEMPGGHATQELAGEILGSRLTQIMIKLTASAPASHDFELRWILADRPGQSWDPPADPFGGMITQGRVERFEPGLGLLFGRDDLELMRQTFHAPAHAAVAQTDLRIAAEESAIDPASLVRRFALYVGSRGRYDRVSDAWYDFKHDGLILALVGLLTRNDHYMRIAAKHAMVFARMEHWSEGFVDRIPPAPTSDGGNARPWRHAAFAPNVAAIQASLLLDMAWHWLTPSGRELVGAALKVKAIPYIDPCLDLNCYTMSCNQGTRFMKGYVLARAAIAPSLDDPALRADLRRRLADFNLSIDRQTREDGTFTEEGYGQSVVENTVSTYRVLSRCLGEPIKMIVTPRIPRCMNFMLDSERKVSPLLAAFAVGALENRRFAAQVAPAHLTAGWNPENHGYGLEAVWTANVIPEQEVTYASALSVYPEGGWVFMGSTDPMLPRVSLESGPWSKQGHIWKHKNAVTIEALGETPLLTRQYALYSDARFPATARTAAYNTFVPGVCGAREQDLNNSGQHGAKLLAARDMGSAAFAVSDAASAWAHNVRRALRRVILLRPGVVIVEDVADFDVDESGVQSWNSLGQWRRVAAGIHECAVGKCVARLTALEPEHVVITSGEDSIHLASVSDAERARTGHSYREMPVYRAAFTSPSAKQHRILTVIELFNVDAPGPASVVRVISRKPLVIEIVQGELTARYAEGDAAAHDLWNHQPTGERTLILRDKAGAITSVSM